MREREAATGPEGLGWAPTPWVTEPGAPPVPVAAPDRRAPQPTASARSTDQETIDPEATNWSGLAMTEPVATLRPGLLVRFVAPGALLALTALLATIPVDGSSGGPTDASSSKLSPIAMIVVLGLAVVGTVYALVMSLVAKVEIDPERVRVTWPSGFYEVTRSAVTGIVRRQGMYSSQHLVLSEETQVLKGSLLRRSRPPTWDEADRLELPGVRTAQIARHLDLEAPPLFDGPDAAQVGHDLRIFMWRDGKPGIFLYALLIATALCAVMIIWGTTAGTG